MKKFIQVLLILVLSLTFLIGAVKYMNSTGLGIPVYPQVVSDTPAEPFSCDVNQRGKMIYVDDSNDTAESYLCFCGVDNDDSTYIWLKAEAPATDCF